MNIALQIRERLGDEWLPSIYATRVRTQRTRSHVLDIQPREQRPEILYTLLGIELKIGKRRFACPDLATARYLRVFGRAGCREFAVPYDITKISALADELETSWHRMLLMLDESAKRVAPSAVGRLRSSLVAMVRSEIAEAGAGEKMPEFRQDTRQRRERA
ncbi:MAG: hypothetical protein ACK4S4_03595 [Pyrinomonadaceae bacterium]